MYHAAPAAASHLAVLCPLPTLTDSFHARKIALLLASEHLHKASLQP